MISIMNPYTFIKDSYNHETLLEARKLKKLEIQLENLELQEFLISDA